MKLTNQEFVKLLSEHLSSDVQNTSAQLAKMVAEFNKSVENGEVFTIKDLGSFYLDEGLVQFDPSDEFSTEINHPYEGMQPVDVDAAQVGESDFEKPIKSKETGKKDNTIVDKAVEEEENPFGIISEEPSVLDSSKIVSEDDIQTEESVIVEPETHLNQDSDDARDAEMVTDEESSEPSLNINTKNTDKTEEETEDFFDFIGVKRDENQPSLENPSEEIEEEVLAESDMDEFSEPDLLETQSDTDGLEETQESDLNVPESSGPRIIKISEHEKTQTDYSAILKMAGIAAILLLVVGAGWWVYSQYFAVVSVSANQTIVMNPGPVDVADSGQSSQTEEDAMFQPGVSIPLGSADDGPMTMAGTEGAVADAIEQPSTPDVAAAGVATRSPASEVHSAPATTMTPLPTVADTSDEIYGLRGTARNIQGSVFAIIVHSLPSQNAANAECDKIVAFGLRCIVREARRPDGGRTYRVGIGQFPSMGVAQEQISSLEEPYRSRNFVARVN